MPLVLKSLPAFRDDYVRALEWLRAMEVRVTNNRLAHYLDTINSAIEREGRGDESHQQNADFAATLVEAFDITQIAMLERAAFDGRKDVLTKLRQLSRGADLPPSKSTDDPARNYAFEFSTGGTLTDRNAFGGFGESTGDVLLKDDLHPVECKRISSLDRVGDRLADGRKQLELGVAAGGKPGIIAIDVSRPIRMGQGPINAIDDDQFEAIASAQISAYIYEHVGKHLELRVECDSVLGVLVRFVAVGTAGGLGHVRTIVDWSLLYVHPDEAPNSKLFLRLAEPFGRGPIRQITPEDIATAMAMVDARVRQD